jgi:hypothetical protein
MHQRRVSPGQIPQKDVVTVQNGVQRQLFFIARHEPQTSKRLRQNVCGTGQTFDVCGTGQTAVVFFWPLINLHNKQ